MQCVQRYANPTESDCTQQPSHPVLFTYQFLLHWHHCLHHTSLMGEQPSQTNKVLFGLVVVTDATLDAFTITSKPLTCVYLVLYLCLVSKHSRKNLIIQLLHHAAKRRV